MEEKKEKKISKKELEEKNALLEEEVLKAKADLINYRKRKDEEVDNFIKYANSSLIESLLPVLDNFERALNVDDEKISAEIKNFLVGFKMIYSNFKDILNSVGVKEIDCLNKQFDSKYENCMYTENNEEYDDSVVLKVITKGYTFNDKVLRCASVIVNKKEKKENNKQKEKEDDKNE